MKKPYILLVSATILASISVQGQSYVGAQGYLLSRYRSYTAELPILSSVNTGFGTARSSAMGGAYTSLGADLSSISMNPAGLGMYRSSEIGLSTNLIVSQYQNKGPLVTNGNADNNTAFKLNNIGLALNMYEGLGDVTSFTFGFSYNRLADFNYNNSVTIRPDNQSLTQIFAYQLWGIPSRDIEIGSNPWGNLDIYPNEWGAILGYQTGLIGAYSEPQDPNWGDRYDELRFKTYYPQGIRKPAYNSGESSTTLIGHSLKTISKGGVSEYNIAGGFNVLNNFYVGVSIGLNDIYQKQDILYTETYTHNDADIPANSMSYQQHTRISGAGANIKVGIIANPVGGLRVGLAIHTPTWNTITKHYSASMGTNFDSGNYFQSSDTWVYEYRFSSQPRLLTGASYTFGNLGIISLDYECDFYNWMRIRVPSTERYYIDGDGNPRDEFADLKEAVKESYKPRHTFRIGAELKPTPQFSLRAGYAHQGSFLKDENAIFNEPLPYKSYNISGGIGYRFNNYISLDLAYVFMKTDYSGYDLFYYDGPDNSASGYDELLGSVIGYQDAIESNLKKHNIIMTLGLRF